VPTRELGDVPAADVVATHDPETGGLTVFAVNRHETEQVALELTVGPFGALEVIEHTVFGGVELEAVNSREEPERVAPWQPAPTNRAALVDGTVRATLPPISWTMLRLEVPRAR